MHVKPKTTEQLAEWIGIRHRAVEGMDVEEEWERICTTLGLTSEELEAVGAEGCRRFIDIYDRGFHAAENMCSTAVQAIRSQLGEKVIGNNYRLTAFSFINIDERMIQLVAERAETTEDEVRAYLKSNERNPKLFRAFAYYGVHPVGKGF
jgi:hypothetical protein